MASANDTDGEESGLRTMTPLTGFHENTEMNVFGWLIFIVMAVVILPLLPVLLAVWLVSKVMGR